MSSQPNLKIHVEFGAEKADFEGSPDAVTKEFLTFLNKVYPTFELAQKLTFNPDLAKLAEELVGVIKLTPDGAVLESTVSPADEAITLSLVGVYVGNRLGKAANDSLSANGLSKMTGKALKTISNQLAWMVDDGLIERVGRGEYKITSVGIMRSEKILQELKAEREKR
jgi:hypothetical protein